MDTCEVALLFRSANIGQYTISQVYKPDKGRELISYNIRWKDVFTDFMFLLTSVYFKTSKIGLRVASKEAIII